MFSIAPAKSLPNIRLGLYKVLLYKRWYIFMSKMCQRIYLLFVSYECLALFSYTFLPSVL